MRAGVLMKLSSEWEGRGTKKLSGDINVNRRLELSGWQLLQKFQITFYGVRVRHYNICVHSVNAGKSRR